MKYVAQHLEVDAIQWTGENYAEILHFVNRDIPVAIEAIAAGAAYAKTYGLRISTANGTFSVDKQSWVIRTSDGAYCVCSDCFFKSAFTARDKQIVTSNVSMLLGALQAIVQRYTEATHKTDAAQSMHSMYSIAQSALKMYAHSRGPLIEERVSSVIQDTTINSGALQMALNVLYRAGKTEVADEVDAASQRLSPKHAKALAILRQPD